MSNFRYIPPAQKELVAQMTLKMTQIEIKEVTGISVRTIQRIQSNLRTFGSVVKKPLQAGKPRELKPWEVAYIEGVIERQPDIYLHEIQQDLQDVFELTISIQTISRTLRRRGYTRKRVTRIAIERDNALRNRYQALMAQYPPETHVYVDEAACNRHTSQRNYTWAPGGTHARKHDFFVRGVRYSILPAISLDGVLHLDIITRAWNGEEFCKFIDVLLGVMNPYPYNNSVVIMDNASAHHFEGLPEMVEQRGMHLVYLPPYSPDLNSIEEGFSAMKAWIQRNRNYILAEMGTESYNPIGLLWDAVMETMTPDSIKGWYRDCGYIIYD